MGCLADYRAARQHRQKWLQKRLAGLTCNLPEQLQDLMLTGPCAGGTDLGPVTRRDMMELLPAATVRLVIPAVPVSHAQVSVHGHMHVPVYFCMHDCLLFLFMCLFLLRFLLMFLFMIGCMHIAAHFCMRFFCSLYMFMSALMCWVFVFVLVFTFTSGRVEACATLAVLTSRQDLL